MTAVGALISAQHCIEYLLPFVQSLRTVMCICYVYVNDV